MNVGAPADPWQTSPSAFASASALQAVGTRLPLPSELASPIAASSPLNFNDVYAKYFDEVARWVRALGGPEAERDDLLQEIFLIVHRRLPDFDGDNLPGWLYQITRRRVRDFRRLLWFRLFFGKAQVDEGFAGAGSDPEAALGAKESEAVLNRLLSRLPEGQRSAFIFFEIEGYSGEEIAALQRVPINTVWARVHKARKKLVEQLSRTRRR